LDVLVVHRGDQAHHGSSLSKPRVSFHAVGIVKFGEMVFTAIWPDVPLFWAKGSALNFGRFAFGQANLHGLVPPGPQKYCFWVMPELEKMLPTHTPGVFDTNKPAPPRNWVMRSVSKL